MKALSQCHDLPLLTTAKCTQFSTRWVARFGECHLRWNLGSPLGMPRKNCKDWQGSIPLALTWLTIHCADANCLVLLHPKASPTLRLDFVCRHPKAISVGRNVLTKVGEVDHRSKDSLETWGIQASSPVVDRSIVFFQSRQCWALDKLCRNLRLVPTVARWTCLPAQKWKRRDLNTHCKRNSRYITAWINTPDSRTQNSCQSKTCVRSKASFSQTKKKKKKNRNTVLSFFGQLSFAALPPFFFQGDAWRDSFLPEVACSFYITETGIVAVKEWDWYKDADTAYKQEHESGSRLDCHSQDTWS